MKLHCVLLTLAFVNISPIMTAEYANVVYVTNKYIEKVFDLNTAGLETAILNIINGDADMETVNLMWAIPEFANIFKIDYHDEEVIENLPETIAIPDQLAVREAIRRVTNIDVPQLDPSQNIENDELLQLGDDRRLITGQVTKKLLIAAIERGSPEFRNLAEICRLIALLRSISFPVFYIKTVTVQSTDECILTSRDGGVYRYEPYKGYIAYIVFATTIPPGPDRRIPQNVLQQIDGWFP